MNSQLQKQLLIGGLAGILVAVLIWFFLGGKRDDLHALRSVNVGLEKDVAKGVALKFNYEKLKAEVAQQEKVIEELIKIMPTDTDRGEIPYRIKKLADAAGIEQISFALLPPLAKDYYTEYPVQFSFRAGFHSLGQFTSLLSGNDKIINMSELAMHREGGNALYPMVVNCKISAFVYNPNPPAASATAPGARPGAPAPPKREGGE